MARRDEEAGPTRPPGAGPGVGPTLAVLGGGLLVVGLSAAPIDRHNVGGLEEDVFRFLNDDLWLPYWPTWLLMQLGSVIVVPLAVAAALAARRPRLAVTAGVAGTLVYVLGKLVRHLVVRGRPARILEDVVVRGDAALGTGYLSGHMALAVAMAAALTPHVGWPGRALVWTLAAFVGLARIHVGAHMPLDVVGGAGLGLAGWAAVHLAATAAPARLAARRTSAEPAAQAPVSE